MIEFKMQVKEVFVRHWPDGSWLADVTFYLPPKLGPGFEPVARVRSGGPLKSPPDVGDWLWVRPGAITGVAGRKESETRDAIGW